MFKISKIQFITITFFFLLSCENGESNATNPLLITDSSTLSVDTTQTTHRDIDLKDDEEQEEEEIVNKIVANYGEQWDFCLCITKNDSIDKAILENDLSDKDLDQLLARMNYVEEKCKMMTSGSQGTPDERKKHAKKVQECLN